MAQLNRTAPENLLNLQSGEYLHIVEEGLIINDVKTVEKRHFVNKINKSVNWKYFRLTINIIFSILVFSSALYLNFYPLSLLLFLSLYDLRNVKRMELPSNKSNFIPFKNIEKVRLVRGKLGFNYAQVFIIDENGKKSLKSIALYDSDSTFASAHRIFSNLNLLEKSILEEEKYSIEGKERVTIGNRVELIFEPERLLFVENDKFNVNRENTYKYVRFIALIMLALGLTAIILKIGLMINSYNLEIVDFAVLAFFIAVTNIPLKLIQKTRPNIILKSDFRKWQETKNKVIISVQSPFFFNFKIHLSKNYLEKEGVEKLKAFFGI